MKMRFYQCKVCGKLIVVLSQEDIPTECCGEAMTEVVPNKTDGAVEKHVPEYEIDGNKVYVRVGVLPHPMTDAHSINWVCLRTKQGFQFKELKPDDAPVVTFAISKKDRVEQVYSFCNIHGLWTSECSDCSTSPKDSEAVSDSSRSAEGMDSADCPECSVSYDSSKSSKPSKTSEKGADK